MTAIDRACVKHVAGLARIALTDDELDRFTGQLQVILGAARRRGHLHRSRSEACRVPRRIREPLQCVPGT